MNDRELQNLVKMAAEIETLEREALVGPGLRPAGVGRDAGDSRFQISRWLGVTGVAAAAAGLAFGAFVALRGGAPATSGGAIAHLPAPSPAEFSAPLATNEHPAAPTGFERPLNHTVSTTDQKSKVLVFSLFKDSDGKCSCYQWHETDGKPLEDMARGELVDIALQAPCTGEAQRVVVIAVGNRNGAVSDPETMASRVAELPLHRDPALAAMVYPALFPNSTVVTETVSMERVKLPTAADLVRPN